MMELQYEKSDLRAIAAISLLNFFTDSFYFIPPVLPEMEELKKDEPGIIQFSKAQESNYTVYPNPASDGVFIRSTQTSLCEEREIVIMGMEGKMHMNTKLKFNNGLASFNTDRLQSGIYILRVKENPKQTFVWKLSIIK
jgi:hypothetical protein